ncbi:AraC family transcriptional regulator [Pantoea alhagi]|uniref:AraC family transcriptional regulator n=1 Tax=Pantoea alhagi TaxID=1891675 RepID=A0A1W6B2K8_9GAMM|nr:EscI/YscI/HrpB family type III secretion system inner rod protein [Pantoea alhagi]ARJ41320.1 AraC family transcriptional regulator [Pantoea alhagi]
MKVNNTSPSLTTSVTLEADDASPEVNKSDAQWFSAALNAPESSTPAGGAPDIISSLTGAISRNQQAQQSAFRDLEVASRSTSSLDFSAANAALSDYYVQSLMNAKIISKGVQSLDKLTNLQ